MLGSDMDKLLVKVKERLIQAEDAMGECKRQGYYDSVLIHEGYINALEFVCNLINASQPNSQRE